MPPEAKSTPSTRVVIDGLGGRHEQKKVEFMMHKSACFLTPGGVAFTSHQTAAILAGFKGEDLLVALATGAGKSTIFYGILVLYDLLYNGFPGSAEYTRRERRTSYFSSGTVSLGVLVCECRPPHPFPVLRIGPSKWPHT